MPLPKDFKEFLELMIQKNVRFMMIGGFAYNLYRNPRLTGDIDFFLEISEENEFNLRGTLKAFGFGTTLPPNDKPLLAENKVLMLGKSPNRIDLIGTIDGVTFLEAWGSVKYVEIDTLTIPVISPEMLLKNKLAAGRPKDLADAHELSLLLKKY